jgi:raffinose/stachyose/melibiose transport system permease protein
MNNSGRGVHEETIFRDTPGRKFDSVRYGRKMTSEKNSEARFYLFMVLPGITLFTLIVVVPILCSVALGFTDFDVYHPERARFIGFAQYARMFYADERLAGEFRTSLVNNLAVIGVSVFGQIPLGFGLAYILFRNRIKGASFFQAMVFLPNFVSTIVIGLLWRNLISPIGPVTALLRFATKDPTALVTWQLERSTAMIPVAFALLWMYTGFYMVVFLANLQRIDHDIFEAAMIDGAGEFRIFTRIAVPMLAGVVFVNSILAIAGSLKGFDLIFAMTGEGISRENSMVLPIYMYKHAFRIQSNDAFSFGSAISNVIVLLSCSLIAFSWAVRRRSASD